ncbi:MAG: FmdB family zinc ribbon protein [Thermoanaerobaculia bacterium]|nr:FmdB family zinc ribbon protein [Thermoanaerobaculia bacterium]
MPIYEYACQECGEHTEAIQRLDDPPLTECGKCGGKLRKLLSAPAFQFKGSGWYVTDYAKKDTGRDKEAGKESAAAASSEKGAKSETASKDSSSSSTDGAKTSPKEKSA